MVLLSGVPRPARYRAERHPSGPVPSVASALADWALFAAVETVAVRMAAEADHDQTRVARTSRHAPKRKFRVSSTVKPLS